MRYYPNALWISIFSISYKPPLLWLKNLKAFGSIFDETLFKWRNFERIMDLIKCISFSKPLLNSAFSNAFPNAFSPAFSNSFPNCFLNCFHKCFFKRFPQNAFSNASSRTFPQLSPMFSPIVPQCRQPTPTPKEQSIRVTKVEILKNCQCPGDFEQKF